MRTLWHLVPSDERGTVHCEYKSSTSHAATPAGYDLAYGQRTLLHQVVYVV